MTETESLGRSFPNSLEDISKHFALFQPLKRITGPLSYRDAVGVSQSKLGELLAHYTGGREYQRAIISIWERVERGVRLPAKYAMTARTRQAYRQLLADVIERAGAGRYRLRARMGPRRWRFQLEADCVQCARPFVLSRAGQVRCRRCIRRNAK